jgi:hypothetical protein
MQDVRTAKFPGQSCVECGEEFTPGESQICQHPTEVGPKGGKRWMHANPGECSSARQNAGRRSFKGEQKAGRLPKRDRTYTAPVAFEVSAFAHKADLAAATSELLAQIAAGSDRELAALAAAELNHRDRLLSGRKKAWGAGPGFADRKKAKNAANNPFDLF